jgi:hypothetical protein
LSEDIFLYSCKDQTDADLISKGKLHDGSCQVAGRMNDLLSFFAIIYAITFNQIIQLTPIHYFGILVVRASVLSKHRTFSLTGKPLY